MECNAWSTARDTGVQMCCMNNAWDHSHCFSCLTLQCLGSHASRPCSLEGTLTPLLVSHAWQIVHVHDTHSPENRAEHYCKLPVLVLVRMLQKCFCLLQHIGITLQSNSSTNWFKGHYQHPNTYFQLPLQMAAERESARYLANGMLQLQHIHTQEQGFAPYLHIAIPY